MSLHAANLINQGGLVQGKGVTIDLATGTLDNSTSGRIGSLGGLTLGAGTLGNSGGLIHADGAAALTLATLTNGGEISAGAGLAVTTGETLDNAAGLLLGNTTTLAAATLSIAAAPYLAVLPRH